MNDTFSEKGIKIFNFFLIFFLFQGSNEFVKRYLIPQILRKYGQSDIGGAFIADTIMNLNRTINSQEVPKEWNKIDPYTAKKIQDNDLKGDFLAIFQRRQPDASLVSIFRYLTVWSEGFLYKSCPTGAKNFANYVFCHPQFSGVILLSKILTPGLDNHLANSDELAQ